MLSPASHARPAALRRVAAVTLAAVLIWAQGIEASALLTTSPRVKKLVESAVATLEKVPYEGTYESQLGSKCLVALALHKAGKTKSPRIREAIEACVREAPAAAKLDTTYNQGLAIVFLTEVAPKRQRSTIQQYMGMLTRRQMPHGGWGYTGENLGDTSQTQYVALAMWQAHRAGLKVTPTEARGLIDWLNRTQSVDGGWAYKGEVATGPELRQQAGATPTLTAAGLASLMIGADLHGLLNSASLAAAGDAAASGAALPPSVRVVRGEVAAPPTLNPKGVDWERVAEAIQMGESWMDKHRDAAAGRYPFYYHYALERYHSFREARQGEFDLEPDWYEKGIEFLESSQASPGKWNRGCGAPADTAFAVLFMLRSTQKSLQKGIGEGALISGRGLPKNLASATLRRGQVVVEMDAVGVGDFLAMIEKGDADRLDALSADPSALVVGDFSAADAERLAQLLRTGEPELRLLAARAFGRAANLDNVPVLLFGMTDPDRRVALAARDAVRAIARRPRGFGMPDDFTDDQRYFEIEQWKRWYQTLRPEAIIDLGR